MNRKFTSNLITIMTLLIGLVSFQSRAFTEEGPVDTPETSTPTEETVSTATDPSVVSEAFGHLIGKNLESLGFEFDMAKVVKGIQDASAGIESPMSEAECVQAISKDQEKKFKKVSEENLAKAEEFLKINSETDGIVSLEENKLQYKVKEQGEGDVVQEHFSPLIKYKGTFLDGKVFGESKEEEMISLDETIPGFSKGIVGMKEGEKRTLYIHPEFGYGTSGYLPPNSLLTFEIEVIKANAAPEQEEEVAATTDSIEADDDDADLAADDADDDTNAVR